MEKKRKSDDKQDQPKKSPKSQPIKETQPEKPSNTASLKYEDNTAYILNNRINPLQNYGIVPIEDRRTRRGLSVSEKNKLRFEKEEAEKKNKPPTPPPQTQQPTQHHVPQQHNIPVPKAPPQAAQQQPQQDQQPHVESMENDEIEGPSKKRKAESESDYGEKRRGNSNGRGQSFGGRGRARGSTFRSRENTRGRGGRGARGGGGATNGGQEADGFDNINKSQYPHLFGQSSGTTAPGTINGVKYFLGEISECRSIHFHGTNAQFKEVLKLCNNLGIAIGKATYFKSGHAIVQPIKQIESFILFFTLNQKNIPTELHRFITKKKSNVSKNIQLTQAFLVILIY